ncbi:patatin-like phospholipase family protein [Actinoplanes sp. HUAS TT8]|uniref:patatin-like phospholipase family protein n=1 Tax=Actinoplanes sp. HUAS TT8 TaxID=3447453 RepID=UPI003F5209F6
MANLIPAPRVPLPGPQWAGDHPVLQVLRKRRAAGTGPGRHGDGNRLALAVEGGGLRGVVSAAMLQALEDLGLRHCFDAVFACSSGAVNSAYFLVGETWYPVSIYYDDLTNRQFLDFRRMLRGRPMMSPSYALDTVVHTIKPLDYDAVLASPVPLHVMVTNVDALRTEVISEFSSTSDFREALRATIWLPIAVPGAAPFRGYRAVDGGVLTAHPFQVVPRTGDQAFTHVLSLSTRPMGTTRRRVTLFNRFVGSRLNRLRAGLGTGYLEAVHVYRQARHEVEAQRLHPRPDPYILDLAPLPGQPEVARHEMNPWLLMEGGRAGYEAVYFALEGVRRRAMPRLMVPDHNRSDFRFPLDLDR